MARLLALLWCLVLTVPLALRADEPIQQALKWPPGKRIQVNFTNGENLSGILDA